MSARTRIHVACPYSCLGDRLCFVSAVRHFARRNPHMEVETEVLPEVVAAFGDDLVRVGVAAKQLLWCRPELRHRVKHASCDRNYLGTYMAELGMVLDAPPALDLPSLEPASDLVPRAYVALQPRSSTATNPAELKRFIDGLVRTCHDVVPEWPVVVVGHPTTERLAPSADHEHLGGPVEFLRILQHAAVVLTPRSAAAHAASAYGVPSFVWVPGDGENWHLDYPSWPHVRTAVEAGSDVLGVLGRFLEDVRAGRIVRPDALRIALARSNVSEKGFFFGLNASCPTDLVAFGATPHTDIVRALITAGTGQDPGRYPPYLNMGNAAEYIQPLAREVCRGRGIDVGAGRWPLLDAHPVRDEPHENALKLDQIEDRSLDYVFSSHCLEHLSEPSPALALWARKLKPGGRLLLYLPHPDMEPWRMGSPWVPEHKWIPTPRRIRELVSSIGLEVKDLTEVPDVYWSFRCIAIARS